MFCLWGRNFWGRLCSRTWRSMLMSLVMPVLQWRPFYPILYFKHCFLVKLGDLHSTLIYTWNAYIIIYISYASNRIITFYNCDCNTPATYHVWQATVAKSASDDELRLACQKLAGAVSSYKQAAKSCRNLSTKPKAKAKAIAEPGANGAM